MRALKEIDEIKVKHYARMERTGSVRQYKKWYNILPTFLFRSKLIKLSEEISGLISDNKLDRSIDITQWMATSLASINLVESKYKLIINNLINLSDLESLISSLPNDRRTRRKFKFHTKNTTKYKQILKDSIQAIYELTGININSGVDHVNQLELVRKHIVFKKDKYNENFKDENKPHEKITILKSASIIFAYMNEPHVGIPEITIVSLAELKDRANERNKREREQIEKYKNR